MTEPGWLAQALRDLRAAAQVSGMTAGEHIGKSQRRISDIERGVYQPRAWEILALCDLYHATPEMRRRLVEAVAGQRSVPRPVAARTAIARGAWKTQQRIGKMEQDSARLRYFHCTVVLGLVQTPEYARAVFSDGGDIPPGDVERSVAERVKRQDILSSGRDITLLMTEGALRWQGVSPQVMAAQVGHIIAASRRVRVGVIPQAAPASVFPLHGFGIHDERAVTVGTRHKALFVTDPADVADYSRLYAALETMAAQGDDARDHLERIAADYRALL